jgi:hypothetical protein
MVLYVRADRPEAGDDADAAVFAWARRDLRGVIENISRRDHHESRVNKFSARENI